MACAAWLLAGCASEPPPEPQVPVVVSTDAPNRSTTKQPAKPTAQTQQGAETREQALRGVEATKAVEALDIRLMDSLSGNGATTAGVLSSSDVPTGLLDDAAKATSRSGGGMAGSGTTASGGSGRLTAGSGAGAVSPGSRGGALDSGPAQPIVIGSIDRNDIVKVVRQHIKPIRRCYERELTRNPNVGGKLIVKFIIGKDGSVAKAMVKSSNTGSNALDQCVVKHFLRMRFPSPRRGIAIVSYPFIFKST